MENQIFSALYEQRKLIIVQSFKTIKYDTGFSKGYVYSVAHDIYPMFDFNEHSDIEIYKDCYKIKEAEIRTFIEYVDKLWNSETKTGFYDLEGKFGKPKRMDLVRMLRYSYLSNAFSGEEFWKNLRLKGPAESSGLTKEFDIFYDL